jgi:hypothetical protein
MDFLHSIHLSLRLPFYHLLLKQYSLKVEVIEGSEIIYSVNFSSILTNEAKT